MVKKTTAPESILPDIEEITYRSVDDWQTLSSAELDEAYGLVPTQRQQYYREVLEREAGKANAVSDADELLVAKALLERFSAGCSGACRSALGQATGSS